MTPEQREDIKLLIAVYESLGADWSIAIEYEVRRFNGSLPSQEAKSKRQETRLKTRPKNT